jgi:hypothetical protein
MNQSSQTGLEAIESEVDASCVMAEEETFRLFQTYKQIITFEAPQTAKRCSKRFIEKCEALAMHAILDSTTVRKADARSREPSLLPWQQRQFHPAFRGTTLNRNMKEPKLLPFALAQLESEAPEKGAVSTWVDDHYPVTPGAGLFFDAGSQPFKQWEKTLQRLVSGEISHIGVVTSNSQILNSFQEHNLVPALRGTTVAIAGDQFDAEHLAFYGRQARERLTSGTFRPSVVYIGTSGIEFDGGSIWFGYHAGELEREAKSLLFECPAKARVILATPRKIGNAGGSVFDVLALEHLNTGAPIRLVSTTPLAGEDSDKIARFERAKKAFLAAELQNALKAKGITFSWTIVNPKTGDAVTLPGDDAS